MKPATKLKPVPTLESLTRDWLDAKERERQANAERLAIEVQIAEALPSANAEATCARDVGEYRVSVRYGVTRKVDSDALQRIWPSLPEEAQAAFRWSAAPALPKLRALQDLRPDVYAKLVPCIEVKPSKPSIAVEKIEEAA